MFADLLSDSPWANRSHRGWTTLASLGLQGLAVGGLLLLPVLYPEGLPSLRSMLPLVAPEAAAVSSAPLQSHRANPANSNLSPDRRLLIPTSIPLVVADLHDEVAAPAIRRDEINGIGLGKGTGDRWTNNPVFNAIAGSAPTVGAPPRPVPAARPLLVSHLMEANLIHRVQPEYPPLAKAARIQGEVVLRAVISKTGAIENLRVLSGHPMLVRAAVDAVQQWLYRPYVLNGEPVEVETQVTVKFVLSGG